ncbi:hypothetical protein JDV02_007746 [Purpureocillium takamizusanense]|uniref:Uncharacterized protein n=1 Tax=Purpureocillium takamizusanense TaxID=2060973 RepID=A0A9Q8QLA3_9HYPO|nr:uncharacterized protein JDV02_007746 [Purpureocillium takamizusanense]UNI21790.1 hypothetical protein JDV02_007746 [Purpureocillium takamizusanense]
MDSGPRGVTQTLAPLHGSQLCNRAHHRWNDVVLHPPHLEFCYVPGSSTSSKRITKALFFKVIIQQVVPELGCKQLVRKNRSRGRGKKNKKIAIHHMARRQ